MVSLTTRPHSMVKHKHSMILGKAVNNCKITVKIEITMVKFYKAGSKTGIPEFCVCMFVILITFYKKHPHADVFKD